MSSFQYKSNHNEIYLLLDEITNMKVDAIVNFFDPNLSNHNTFALEIFRKGGDFLEGQFLQKYSQHHDFSTVMMTNGGALHCKNVMHTISFMNKPDSKGYYDAINQKISRCLHLAKSEKFNSIAFPVIQSESIEDIIFKSYCAALTSYNGDYPKEIYCVCADRGLLERFRKIFLDSNISLSLPKTPAFDLQTNYPAMSAPSGAMAAEETPMDVDMPNATETNDSCPICLCDFTDKKTLDKCGHSFCSACIDHSFSAVGSSCPVCQTHYGKIIGQQPPGAMYVKKENRSLPGFLGYGTYILDYKIPDGIQKAGHPSPGKRFYGTSRTAFLPANNGGETVLKMLQKAFQQKVIFTVGISRTTDMKDTVTWNDIHHKTSRFGGPSEFGYPDADYLKRVTLELEAKGVNAKSVAHERISFYLESK